jgi:hypothetical protein
VRALARFWAASRLHSVEAKLFRESALRNRNPISNYATPHIWRFSAEFTQMWGWANSDMDFTEAMSDSLLFHCEKQ